MLFSSVPSPSHTRPGFKASPPASLGTVVPSLATASCLAHPTLACPPAPTPTPMPMPVDGCSVHASIYTHHAHTQLTTPSSASLPLGPIPLQSPPPRASFAASPLLLRALLAPSSHTVSWSIGHALRYLQTN